MSTTLPTYPHFIAILPTYQQIWIYFHMHILLLLPFQKCLQFVRIPCLGEKMCGGGMYQFALNLRTGVLCAVRVSGYVNEIRRRPSETIVTKGQSPCE